MAFPEPVPSLVQTEASFVWPGSDVRPRTPGDSASVGHGPLPFTLYEEIRTKFIAGHQETRQGRAAQRVTWHSRIISVPAAGDHFVRQRHATTPNAIAGAVSVRPAAAGTGSSIIGFIHGVWGSSRPVRRHTRLPAVPQSAIMAAITVACAAAFRVG